MFQSGNGLLSLCFYKVFFSITNQHLIIYICNVISLTTLCYNAWYQHWLYLCCTSQFIKLSIIVWLPYMLLHHGNAFQFCFILVIVKNWILLSFCQYVHYILLKYINKIICHLWWKNVKSVSWIWFEYSFFFQITCIGVGDVFNKGKVNKMINCICTALHDVDFLSCYR